MTGARGRRFGAGGSWLGYRFGQASRVFWRLVGVIAIAAPGPLGHLTSTCDVGVKLPLPSLKVCNSYSKQVKMRAAVTASKETFLSLLAGFITFYTIIIHFEAT